MWTISNWQRKGYSCLCMWTTWNWLGRNKTLTQWGKYLWKKSFSANQHPPLTMFIWVALRDNVKQAKILWTITKICLNPGSLQERKKNYHARKILVSLRGLMTWKVMPRNVWSDIVSWRRKQPSNCTKFQLHALMTINSKKMNWDLLENCQKFCSQIVLKCLYLARIGRLDILWSVNKLARSITKWTKDCDKRLARLISYIHHTKKFTILLCGKHRTTMQGGTVSGLWFCWRSGRLKIDFRWKFVHISHKLDVQETNFCFVLINGIWDYLSWSMSTHGWIPALDLCDLVIEVFHSSPNQADKARDLAELQGNLLQSTTLNIRSQIPTKHINLDLNNVDHVSSNVNSSRKEALLYIFEDNEAVIKMIIKGRSPTT